MTGKVVFTEGHWKLLTEKDGKEVHKQITEKELHDLITAQKVSISFGEKIIKTLQEV